MDTSYALILVWPSLELLIIVFYEKSVKIRVQFRKLAQSKSLLEHLNLPIDIAAAYRSKDTSYHAIIITEKPDSKNLSKCTTISLPCCENAKAASIMIFYA